MEQQRYQSLGVSADKTGLHEALKTAGISGDARLFAQVSSDLSGSPEHRSFVHCDGAGTKTIVPYLWFKDTGDRSLFAGLAQDALVMNLDDIYCIGVPQSLLLANAIARNARLIDDDILAVLFSSYKRLTELFSSLGIPLEMTGGETADCGDVVRTLMVDAVLCGRIKTQALISADEIRPGNCIVGLSSTGRAVYEDAPNSGIGSNGLTLARHALLEHRYAGQYPEVVDPGLAPQSAYTGPFSTTDRPAQLGMSIGEALSSPTRTYAPVLNKILAEAGDTVHGIIHLTGGGQTKGLRFGRGNLYVKDNLFPTPPLFALIQEYGQVPWREMYRVFNMGHRMEIYCDAACADAIKSIASGFGVEARVVGRVEPQADGRNTVQIESDKGSFSYQLS